MISKKGKLLGLFILLTQFIQLCAAQTASSINSQEGTLADELRTVEGISFVLQQNENFREFYEIRVTQKLDHFQESGEFFEQKIFLGYNDSEAPTLLSIEGYEMGNPVPASALKDCNLISVEHRFFGESLPDSLDWNYLTIQQAANDLHHIHQVFSKILKGKWMSTGISKGGQTALAYKMFFPGDMEAVLAISTPVKNGLNDSRLSDISTSISKFPCGKEVLGFQQFAFKNKDSLLLQLDKMVEEKKYSFGQLNPETVLEYILLEFPFAFFQNGNTCDKLPDTTASYPSLFHAISKVVSPRFYSSEFRNKREPAFYTFYHQLGYYEYSLAPFRQWLSGENYSNRIFAPANVSIVFDPGYLDSLNQFLNENITEKIIFLLGEFDPYAITRPDFGSKTNCLVLMVKDGSHRSRINDLDKQQKEILNEILSDWLDWKISY